MITNQLPKEGAKKPKKTNGKPDKEKSWMYPFENKILPRGGGIGFAKAAYTRLLFEKLNFTEEEIEKISNNSEDFCKRSAEKFEEERRKIIFKEDYQKIIRRHYPTPVPTTRWEPSPGDLPSPIDICLASSQNFQYLHAQAKGWGTLEGFDETPFEADIQFTFTLPFTGYYKFNTEVWAFGSYYLIADDGSCDSKKANVRMYTNIHIRQIVPKVINQLSKPDDILYLVDETNGIALFFEDGGQNINKLEPIFDKKELNTSGIFLYRNVPVTITVKVIAVVYARGKGSYADVNCSQGHGGIYCDRLCIKSV